MYKAVTLFLWQSAVPIVVTYNSPSFLKFSQMKIKVYLDAILISLKIKKSTLSPTPAKSSISQCLQERCDCRNHSNSIESHPIEDRELFTFDNSDQQTTELQEETTALELIQEFHHSGTQRYTKEMYILNTNISSEGKFLWFKTQWSYL